MADETAPSWRMLSEEVLTGMKEWRQAHPKATLREIQEAVTERMSRLTACMIQDMALTSPANDWSTQPLPERPQYPHYTTPLQARGKRSRHLLRTGGQDVERKQTYGTCQTCGAGLFP
jgi:RNA polymerase-binding transcription factor DksA